MSDRVVALAPQEELPADPSEARLLMRSGRHAGPSGGMAPGYLQGNLVILAAADALDFFRFCQRNPKPCPLIGVSDTGDPMLNTLGDDIDIRSDIGSYNVFRDGELVEQVGDIHRFWRDDLVAFVLGCSYSFEAALAAEGVPLKHWAKGTIVPMYYSNIATQPAGPFQGGMVVSMRPMSVADAIRAAAITSRFPHAHGAPVHMGQPELIGIDDIDEPDDGEALPIEAGEIPVFWACGVTPQIALQNARPPLCITHTPGCMLITDKLAAKG